MSLNVGELHATLGLKDSAFETGLDRADGRWSAFGSGLLRVGGAAGIAAGAAVAAGVVKGVGEFASLEKGMNEVFTLLPDISERAMGEMTDQVRDFSKEMGVLPDQTVPALYQAISAGVPKGNVFDFLETAQKAAVGGVTDLETAVDGISSVVNAYGSDVIDAAKASDLMFTAVRLGKTDFSQLSASLFNVLPTASALGVGFEDITAAMATMTAQGVPTSVATTQLRQLLVELSKDGTKASDAFKEIAGKGFADFVASGGDVNDALGIMSQAARDNGVAVQDMFGSVEAGAAALSLLSSDSFADNLDEMGKAAGSTDKAYQRMDKGLSRSWDRIKASVNDAIIEIGDRLAPFIQLSADWLEDKLPRAIEFFSDAWETASSTIGPIIEWIRGLFGGLGSTGEGMGSRLGAVFESVRGAISKASEIIGAVVGGMTEWFDANRSKIEKIFGKVRTVIEKVMEAVKVAIDTVVAVVTFIWDNFGETIIGVLQSVWTTITGIIDGALSVIGGILDVFIGIFTGDWSRAWEGVKSIFGGIWDIIKSIVTGAVRNVKTVISGLISTIGRWFGDLPSKIVSWIGDFASLLVDKGRDLITGLWNGIKSMGTWIKDKITGWIKEVVPGPIASVLGIASPSKLMEQMGTELPAGLVKGMRSGVSDVMTAAETMAAAALPDMDRLAVAVAGAGGPTISFGDINARTDADPRDIADEIFWQAKTRGV